MTLVDLYVSRTERGRGLASVEDYEDASLQGLNEYIKKKTEED